MRSVWEPCRRKIAKTEPIENRRWPPQPPSWKSIFDISSHVWSIWAETCSVATGQRLDRNKLNLCRSEMQDGRHSCHPENLFWTSSRKPQGELNWNLQCSNRLTCRLKIARSCRLEIQNGCHSCRLKINFWLILQHSWAIWVETHCSNRMTPRSKIANTVPIGNPRWLPQLPCCF